MSKNQKEKIFVYNYLLLNRTYFKTIFINQSFLFNHYKTLVGGKKNINSQTRQIYMFILRDLLFTEEISHFKDDDFFKTNDEFQKLYSIFSKIDTEEMDQSIYLELTKVIDKFFKEEITDLKKLNLEDNGNFIFSYYSKDYKIMQFKKKMKIYVEKFLRIKFNPNLLKQCLKNKKIKKKIYNDNNIKKFNNLYLMEKKELIQKLKILIPAYNKNVLSKSKTIDLKKFITKNFNDSFLLKDLTSIKNKSIDDASILNLLNDKINTKISFENLKNIGKSGLSINAIKNNFRSNHLDDTESGIESNIEFEIESNIESNTEFNNVEFNIEDSLSRNVDMLYCPDSMNALLEEEGIKRLLQEKDITIESEFNNTESNTGSEFNNTELNTEFILEDSILISSDDWYVLYKSISNNSFINNTSTPDITISKIVSSPYFDILNNFF